MELFRMIMSHAVGGAVSPAESVAEIKPAAPWQR